MPPFAASDLDYFERVETTPASSRALWACWVDVATWGDWSGWSRRSYVDDSFTLGSRGVVIDRFGRTLSFTVTALNPMHSLEISLKVPGATVVMRYEIIGANEAATSFCHSVRVEGRCAWLWRRAVRLRFEREAPTDMRRLAHLADDSGTHRGSQNPTPISGRRFPLSGQDFAAARADPRPGTVRTHGRMLSGRGKPQGVRRQASPSR